MLKHFSQVRSFLSIALCLGAGQLLWKAEARAADRVELSSIENQFEATVSDKPPEELGKMIGFAAGIEKGSELTFQQKSSVPNLDHFHYEQTFNGVPVWGERVTISRNKANEIVRTSGAVVRGLSFDVPSVRAELSPEAALDRAKSEVRQGAGIAASDLKSENDSVRLMVYVRPSDKKAFLSYEVTFFAVDKAAGKPTRPFFLIDAKTGEVLYRYEGLANDFGTGPGGNDRTGKYFYGKGKLPPFEVRASGPKCTMETKDVVTANYNNEITAPDTPFEFKCKQNAYRETNGAYAPLNDAHYFATVTVNMFRQWYNIDPIKGKVLLRVHYGKDLQNAFWNGKNLTFGDGGEMFYPLVGLDIMAHELSHGFTEQHSGLIYAGESGAINEAFSDMAGEAAKAFAAFGREPEFRIGASILKGKENKPLRYLCEPKRDGKSIDHMNEYTAGLDVHFGSGIYNKAFCLLAKTSGWNVRKTFGVFLAANRDYWAPSTTFVSGARDLVHAAQDAGYPVAEVKAAFAAVGIDASAPPVPPPASAAAVPPKSEASVQPSLAAVEAPSAPPPRKASVSDNAVNPASPTDAASPSAPEPAIEQSEAPAKTAGLPEASERIRIVGEWSIANSADTILIRNDQWFHSKHGRARIREAVDEADLKVFYTNNDVHCSYRVTTSDAGKTLNLIAADPSQDPDFCPSGSLRSLER
jgi:Zn-dependent metalloprotease